MPCRGCHKPIPFRHQVLDALEANAGQSGVGLRQGMLGALLEHGSASLPRRTSRARRSTDGGTGRSVGGNEHGARLDLVIDSGREALIDALAQRGAIARRDTALVLEHVGTDHFHAVLSVALGRSLELDSTRRLALLEATASVVGLHGPDSPWATICSGANPPRLCWYIHARRHCPSITRIASEVVVDHLLHHYELLDETSYRLLLDTRVATLSDALGAVDLTVAEVREIANSDLFDAEERRALVAAARRGSVEILDREGVAEPCAGPNPPRWCHAARALPVLDALLRALDDKGAVARTALLESLGLGVEERAPSPTP